MLLSAARLLPRGRAVGVDLWRPDQTGNSAEATRRNAQLEGVADRVELHTADMTLLPFAGDAFDVVVSNLALHNIPTAAGRVLRPGGRLLLVDLAFTGRRPRGCASSGCGTCGGADWAGGCGGAGRGSGRMP